MLVFCDLSTLLLEEIEDKGSDSNHYCITCCEGSQLGNEMLKQFCGSVLRVVM